MKHNKLLVFILVMILMCSFMLASCDVNDKPENGNEEPVWSDWKITITPSLNTTGTIERTSNKGDKEEYTLPKLTDSAYIVDVLSNPKCEEEGESQYTITAKEKTFIFTVKTKPISHNWSVSYVFSEDGSSCVATRACKNDASHNILAEAVITSKQTKEPTFKAKGETTYTATFTEFWAETQTKVVADIPMYTLTKVDRIEPTVNDVGNILYYKGSNGKYYKDENAEEEITLEDTIIAKVTVEKVEQVNPAYGANGCKEYYKDASGNKFVMKNEKLVSVLDEDLVIDELLGTVYIYIDDIKQDATITHKKSEIIQSKDLHAIIEKYRPDSSVSALLSREKDDPTTTQFYTFQDLAKENQELTIYVRTRFTLNYVFNNGDEDFSHYIYYGHTMAVQAPPTRVDYTFVGWYYNADFSGEKLGETIVGAKHDTTVYAKWKLNYQEGLQFEEFNNAAILTGYTGSSNEVILPATALNLPVTTIGKNAFDVNAGNNNKITKINIGNVQEIDDKAFASCSDLSEIIMNEYNIKINNNVFFDCPLIKTLDFNHICSLGANVFSESVVFDELRLPQNISLSDFAIPNKINNLYYEPLDDVKVCYNAFDDVSIVYGNLKLLSSLSLNKSNRFNVVNETHLPEGSLNTFVSCDIFLSSSITSAAKNAFDDMQRVFYEGDFLPFGFDPEWKTANSDAYVRKPAKVEGLDDIVTGYWDYDENNNIVVIEDVGIKYHRATDNKSYEITGVTNTTQNVLDVPQTFYNLPITSIKENAFTSSGLTSARIPYIKEIKANAFADSTSLSSIVVGSNLSAIGNNAFANTSLNTLDLSKANIRELSQGICKNITELTSISLPNELHSIGSEAFLGCTSLSSVSLPKYLDTISISAFKGCTNLATLDLSNNMALAIIEDEAFMNTKLESLDFSKYRFLDLGVGAFENCASLTSVILPGDFNRIKERTFKNCTSLSSCPIPEGVKDIETEAFLNCTSLTNLVIPNAVETIWDAAFMGCNSITNININIEESMLNTVNANAFNGLAITKLTIPKNLLITGVSSFANCNNLVQVRAHYVSDLSRLLSDCPTITDILYKENTKNDIINSYKNKYDIYQYLETAPEVPSEIVGVLGYWHGDGEIWPSLFDFYEFDTTANILGYKGTRSDINLVIPARYNKKTITTISSDFMKNTNIKSVTIPKAVTVIQSGAFYQCNELTRIAFDGESQLKSIQYEAFGFCKKLKNVLLPGSLNNFHCKAFLGTNLDSIAVTYPGKYDNSNNSLYDPSARMIIKGTNKTEIDVNNCMCKNFGPYCFAYMERFTTLHIHDYHYRFYEGAFYGCPNLKEVLTDEYTSVREYGPAVFGGCPNLETLILKGNTIFPLEDGCSIVFVSPKAKIYLRSSSDPGAGFNAINGFDIAPTYYYSEMERHDETPAYISGWWHYDANNKPVLW